MNIDVIPLYPALCQLEQATQKILAANDLGFSCASNADRIVPRHYRPYFFATGKIDAGHWLVSAGLLFPDSGVDLRRQPKNANVDLVFIAFFRIWWPCRISDRGGHWFTVQYELRRKTPIPNRPYLVRVNCCDPVLVVGRKSQEAI